MTKDPNLTSVMQAADALGHLMDDLVLVGGCAVGLLVTDPAAPSVRHTIDIDLVTEVAPLSNYYDLCDQLKRKGFQESPEVICRWRKDLLIIDVMPTEEGVLQFTNSWYAEAARTFEVHDLPNGRAIRAISAALFIATKLESFASRGGGDYLHHDMEDIVTIVDGRDTIQEDVMKASEGVRAYIRDEFETLLGDPHFTDRLEWLLQGEVERIAIVIERMRKVCGQ